MPGKALHFIDRGAEDRHHVESARGQRRVRVGQLVDAEFGERAGRIAEKRQQRQPADAVDGDRLAVDVDQLQCRRLRGCKQSHLAFPLRCGWTMAMWMRQSQVRFPSAFCRVRRLRHTWRMIDTDEGAAEDIGALLGAEGPFARELPGLPRGRCSRPWRVPCSGHRGARDAGRRSRHRHRQDLRLSGAGAAVRRQGHHLHRHQDAAGPAVSSATCRACARYWAARVGRAAQGPRELSVPVPAGADRAATGGCSRDACGATGGHPRLVAHARDTATEGELAEVPEESRDVAARHLDRRKLPRRRVSSSTPSASCSTRDARRRRRTSSWSTTTCSSPTWRSSDERRWRAAAAARRRSFSTRRTRCRNWPASFSRRASSARQLTELARDVLAECNGITGAIGLLLEPVRRCRRPRARCGWRSRGCRRRARLRAACARGASSPALMT